MPKLGLFIQGRSAPYKLDRVHAEVPASVQRRFRAKPTERQLDALLAAMNTPDIAIIQGPPGTGKTDVIAALEVWLAEDGQSGGSLSKSVLLTSYQHDAVDNAASRSSVLDLPAMRVGGRHGESEEPPDAIAWADALAAELRADLARRSDGQLVRDVRELQGRVRLYALDPTPPEQTATLLEDVAAMGAGLLPADLCERLRERASELRRPARRDSLDDLDGEALRSAARALRTSAAAFGDDGPATAGKLLVRLRRRSSTPAEELELLARATETDEPEPELLAALGKLRERLLEELLEDDDPVGPPLPDATARELLSAAAREAGQRLRASRDGVGGVIAHVVEALENDPHAIARTLGNYTAILAATCQQSAGRAMALHKDMRLEFETVIVDEAARANPLDLMIPLAQARRRIVLVGDQRQLPHVLEPEVERELDGNVAEETQAALRESLFERLFEDLMERERRGEPARVVTLDKQFRMHPALGGFVSRTFYESHGTALDSPRPDSDFPVSLRPFPGAVAAWVDLPYARGGERQGLSKSRPVEAEWIGEHLVDLMEQEPSLSFGVISFYSAQVKAIEVALERRGVMLPGDDDRLEIAPRWRETTDEDGRRVARLRVGTVDAFQGREFDVVLLSLARSSRSTGSTHPAAQRRRFGHLMLENRLCVAMSRQRRMLIVVGDREQAISAEGAAAVPALAAFDELCGGDLGARVRP